MNFKLKIKVFGFYLRKFALFFPIFSLDANEIHKGLKLAECDYYHLLKMQIHFGKYSTKSMDFVSTSALKPCTFNGKKMLLLVANNAATKKNILKCKRRWWLLSFLCFFYFNFFFLVNFAIQKQKYFKIHMYMYYFKYKCIFMHMFKRTLSFTDKKKTKALLVNFGLVKYLKTKKNKNWNI